MNNSSHPNSAEPLVLIKGLSKEFPSAGQSPIHALRGIDLSFNSGEIIGLLGPNGAGKTTLIDIILGLTTPTSGSVSIFGTSPHSAVKDARVGAVMQSGGLLPDMTVESTVRMIAHTYQYPEPIEEILEQANLTEIRTRRVGKCSGGEQQRLRFALALLGNPDLIILDEPTTGMDPSNRHLFWEAMQVQAERGKTIVFATHYLEEAQNFAHRIVFMSGGQIIADGSTNSICSMTDSHVIECTLPAETMPPERFPGVISVERFGESIKMSTKDSDALALFLLTKAGARNLRITSNSLEDTFIQLTQQEDKQ